jgi:hypothetical protein
MSSNATPKNLAVLRALTHDLADGLHDLEDAIGMKQNKEENVRAALLPLEGDPDADVNVNPAAFKGSIMVYDERKAATALARKAVGDLSDGAVHDFLLAASAVLGGILGRKWNSAWLPTGFPNNSTAVPTTQEARFSLLLSLKNYFTANPTHQLNQPPHEEVTAARAAALHAQMSNARQAVNDREGDQAAAKNVRDGHQRALFKRVSGTIEEVGQVLAPDDPRWENLGLNIPANPTPPEAVEAVTLSSGGSGKVLAEWARSRRSERFRVMVQIVGTDPDFREEVVVHDLNATLKSLPVGATLRVQITAANEAGDAAPSPAAEIVVV